MQLRQMRTMQMAKTIEASEASGEREINRRPQFLPHENIIVYVSTDSVVAMVCDRLVASCRAKIRLLGVAGAGVLVARYHSCWYVSDARDHFTSRTDRVAVDNVRVSCLGTPCPTTHVNRTVTARPVALPHCESKRFLCNYIAIAFQLSTGAHSTALKEPRLGSIIHNSSCFWLTESYWQNSS